MAKSVDLKSLAIGGLLALSVTYILGASPRQASPSPVRRFTIVVSEVSDNEAFVLDTITGQVWRYAAGRGTDKFYGPKLETQTPEEPGESRLQ